MIQPQPKDQSNLQSLKLSMSAHGDLAQIEVPKALIMSLGCFNVARG
jgi:hypothetical protein